MTPPGRWSAWALAEAFQLAHAADFVVATDLLDGTERPVPALASKADVDPGLLGALLELLASRTDLVTRGPDGFRKGPGLGPIEEATIDQYVGAYGPNASSLAEILASPDRGRDLVDRDRHATAFARAPGPGAVLLPDLLTRLELGNVLDLGCGTGELLVTLASGDSDFRGWGVDANPAMVALAEERLRLGGAGDDQVRFYVGDVRDPARCAPTGVLGDVATVVAASLVNEFFHPDAVTAVRWLGDLRQALPGRVLVVADYYGALGHMADPTPRRAVHDWIQLISGQGVPPPDLAGWEAVYVKAGCTLLHAVEDTDAGVFIHFVRLAQSDPS
ncbi:MAG: class I SAM-dependent methyltransferase [Acidimicrobiales bacterium]